MFTLWFLKEVKFTFGGNFLKGARDGFIDDAKQFSNIDIKEAEVNRNALEECLPPSKWFKQQDYDDAIRQLGKGRLSAALKALKVKPDEGVPDICVWVFQNVFIKVARGAPRLLSDALPSKWY